MLNDRLFCELALLDDYKKKHRFLKEYKITRKKPLKLSFTLHVKKHEYKFDAIFNRYFPYQPIEIIARTKFYTPHKYNDGAMCLKYGPDNWQTNITLVNLIDNLYELLFAENPLGKKHGVSPNGDVFTFGQNVRKKGAAYMILPIHPRCFQNKTGSLKVTHFDGKQFSLFVREIDGTKYCAGRSDGQEYVYYISDKPYTNESADSIRKSLNIDKSTNVVVLYYNGCFSLLFRNDNKNYYLNYIIGDYDKGNRLDILEETIDKKITIIGLGSVGSRIAVDLARAGYKNFFFVDDDIFMPCNIIRHELSSNDFGKFKVEALKDFICNCINDKASIEVSRLAMTGQESTTSADRFLNMCSDSAIIIDCTACDSLLFLLNKMTIDKKIPVLSGTVIPGGLGNIILYKPRESMIDLESILASYYCWKNDKIIFGDRINDYSSAIGNQPYIATMSDCSILAGLLGRFAIDILHNKTIQLDNINVFSTSNYQDLKEYYQTYKITANRINKEETHYEEELVEKGRLIYEDNYPRKNIRKNNKKA